MFTNERDEQLWVEFSARHSTLTQFVWCLPSITTSYATKHAHAYWKRQLYWNSIRNALRGGKNESNAQIQIQCTATTHTHNGKRVASTNRVLERKILTKSRKQLFICYFYCRWFRCTFSKWRKYLWFFAFISGNMWFSALAAEKSKSKVFFSLHAVATQTTKLIFFVSTA